MLDLRSGSMFEVVLTEDVTRLILDDPPTPRRGQSITLQQDATGDHSFAWPAKTKRASGSRPALSWAAEAVEVYALVMRDGRTTCYGFAGGKGFS